MTGEVDYINPETYEITRKTMEVPIPHTDGCGMMVEGTTTMVRLPWIKGLMVKFDFRKFATEHEAYYVSDIYGVQHNILTEDIKYIFTKSQFKMHKYYDSWEQYKEYYKEYNCTAGKTNEEEKYIPDAKINYQMLQSLTDIKEKEMIKLASKSVNDICSVGYDFRTTMKLLGATEQNINPNSMQKALMIYPELMSDPYNKQILKDVKKSLVKQSKAGKLMIDGKYTFIAPDLYAFCQYLFLGEEKVTGLLESSEVSCNLYPDKKDLDCLRSPHLYREHAVRKNKNNEITKKWFDTKCIYTSCNDLISKLLQFD